MLPGVRVWSARLRRFRCGLLGHRLEFALGIPEDGEPGSVSVKEWCARCPWEDFWYMGADDGMADPHV